MPNWLVPGGTMVLSGIDIPMANATITPVWQDQSLIWALTDHVGGATYRIDTEGTAGPADWHLPGTRVSLTLDGQTGTLAPQVLSVAEAAPSSTQGMTGALGLQAELATIVSASVGEQAFYVAAAADGSGITSFAATADGMLGEARERADNTSLYLSNVSDLAIIETNESVFVAAGSASEHGVSVFRLAGSGSLNEAASLGMAESVPIQSVSALEATEVGGRDYLIAAAAGSSSLTVFEVSADGVLRVVDHVFDTLDTRFAGVGELASVVVGGQTFVITSGMDDGISLFQLTAEGRLVHRDSLADQTDLALASVSALGAVPTAAGFEIRTASSAEVELSQIRVDFTPGLVTAQASGTVTGGGGDDLLSLTGIGGGVITGGAGRDLISDGAGGDTLTGGAGADTFLMQRDGQRDVITDIEVGQDLLDLSLWPFLYSVDQIEVESTASGAVLSFGDEVLELLSTDGNSLDAARIAQLLAAGPGRTEVSVAPLQQAEAPPRPDPFPDTVPGPGPPPGTVPPRGSVPDPQPGPDPQPQPDPGPDGQVLDGSAADDVLEGGPENDMIGGRDGNDTLRGNGGDDTLAGAAGEDRVLGGPGRDSLGGGTGDDWMEGGPDHDTLGGGQGHDDILGQDGNDVASGGPGNDTIEGGNGDDVLAGSFGDDVVKGGDGNDDLGGGTGRDRLTGGAGNDSLGGGEGDDTVKGGEGADFLAGGGRDDDLQGEAGADRLNGGAGDDTLTGGGGADVFVFNTMISGDRDVITDFQVGVDVLRLGGVTGQGQAGRFDALQITGAGGGTEVSWGGQVIFLDDVAPDAFGVEDVVFV